MRIPRQGVYTYRRTSIEARCESGGGMKGTCFLEVEGWKKFNSNFFIISFGVPLQFRGFRFRLVIIFSNRWRCPISIWKGIGLHPPPSSHENWYHSSRLWIRIISRDFEISEENFRYRTHDVIVSEKYRIIFDTQNFFRPFYCRKKVEKGRKKKSNNIKVTM